MWSIQRCSAVWSWPESGACRLADYRGLRDEQRRRREHGPQRSLLGLGIGSYVERSGGQQGSDEYGAVEVRADVRYQVLFVVMGAAWVFHLPRLLAFIGVSYRDDALERRNTSAAIAIVGTIAGLAIVFAGSNMGEGPSIWNTVATTPPR